MSTLRVNTIQDSTGSSSPAINGLAKAWVNFNGTGTVAIRASLNVSSITDNGTGDYTVNFATAMSDINYTPVISSSRQSEINTISINTNNSTGNDVAPTVSGFRIGLLQFGVTQRDGTYVSAAVFR
jgi:hypothetical protein